MPTGTRLIQELLDMSGTCSSGHIGRLVNCLSGFGDFSIRISWLDQMIGSVTARLNTMITKIKDTFNTDEYLVIIVKNWMHDTSNKLLTLHSYEIQDKVDTKIYNELIKDFISKNKEKMVDVWLEYFEEAVMFEMTLPLDKHDIRQNFLFFFRCSLPYIKEELYTEYKEYLSDTDFDLTLMKAFMHYIGDR